MLVPGHVVSLYVATCGLNGTALGSDEKEIILLVYAIIDAQTNNIVGLKQYLVRPTNPFGKEAPTEPLTPDGSLSPEISIPETLIQNNGRQLEEVIDQFDAYTKSLNIDPNSPNFRLVTDGQLPLRQCLHPEASAKDIKLPSYYWRFSDLRKEFVRYKSGDLSRALISVADITKLNTMPSLPPLPNSIADMLQELALPSYQESDFYVKEAHDMIKIVQTLISAGHKFDATEPINLNLEPGICSIDDEIDGTCIVRARGLPWQSSDQDIAKFFRGLNVAKGGVALCLSPQGRRNGEALIRFVSQEHRDMALKRHKHHIGNRYIEVYRATGDDFLSVAGGASNEAQAFLSKGAQVIIRMRGLPYDCTAKQVLDFFANGESSCNVLDSNDGILFVKKPDGRATGDAFVLFSQESDAPKALSKHRESIGQRYIELFRSTTAEVQQVLNRSMDPKTYELPQPPLIAQLPPPVQMPLLPQHVITSGTEKNCIRLRGLPYEAKVEHILHFLEDFAKNIVYQGVHLVYNAQGQFNGEAFIQMDSEASAFQSAQQRHHKNMMFGKKQRYIEVFQCSGDDMNMVLNGGFQPPTNMSKPPLLSPGMLPSPQQPPPQSSQSLPLSPISLSVPPPLTLSIPPPNPQLIAQQQAHFIAQQNLIARQAAAAAAAQQHNEQILLHNLNVYQSQAAAAAPSASQQSQLHYAHHSAAHHQQQQQQQHHYHQHQQQHMFPPQMAHHPGAPQFIFMPRHMISPTGIPVGLMPPFNHIQFTAGPGLPPPGAAAALAHPGSLPQQHQAAAAAAAAASVAVSQASMMPHSIKRSYDNAFRNEQTALNANAPKRQFHGAPGGAIYAPFYHHPHL